MQMDIQRLRNLTTGRLHTRIDHVYQDLQYLIGVEGLMTHQLGNANKALEPYLRNAIPDQRFWDGKYDITHVGDYPIVSAEGAERDEILERYKGLPSPLLRFSVSDK